MKTLTIVFAIASCFILACTKQPSHGRTQEQIDKDSAALIQSHYAITKQCTTLISDTLQLLDSPLHFVNYSDTGRNISYKWDFGDGTTSQSLHPSHTFRKIGLYKVSLTAFYKTQPASTFTQNVKIVVGQKSFRSSFSYNRAIDIVETSTKNLLLLASTDYQSTATPGYMLVCMDSLLKEKWRKQFSPPGSRLHSIRKINSTEFIIAGSINAGNSGQFALSKIDGNGNTVWVKMIPNTAGENVFANVTGDGGLITIGNSGTAGSPYCLVIKCDANGNELWRKSFTNPLSYIHLSDAQNIIETPAGYVFAGLKRGFYASDVYLTQLDFNGNIVRQTFATSDGSYGTVFEAGVARVGNNFMVNLENTPYAGVFKSDLSFVSFKKMGETSLNWVTSSTNNFFFAEGSHQYGHSIMANENGTKQWETLINNQILLSCTSVHLGATRYCKRVLYTSSNDVVALSDGQRTENVNEGWVPFVERFSLDGSIK